MVYVLVLKFSSSNGHFKQALRGGQSLKQRIWDGVKPIISEWVGHDLKDTSLYGIRVYKEGSILATRKCTIE